MAGMMAADLRVSDTELERWPDDGRRYELYHGEVRAVPSPILHGVKEYWLVDPVAVRVDVYRLIGGTFELASTASREEFVRSALLPRLAFAASNLEVRSKK